MGAVAQAHRRVPTDPRDWALGCQVQPRGDVYIHNVSTSGVECNWFHAASMSNSSGQCHRTRTKAQRNSVRECLSEVLARSHAIHVKTLQRKEQETAETTMNISGAGGLHCKIAQRQDIEPNKTNTLVVWLEQGITPESPRSTCERHPLTLLKGFSFKVTGKNSCWEQE